MEVSFIDSAGFSETVASDATTITWNIYLHADNQDQKDIWSDGETMWVADTKDYVIYAYPLPNSPATGQLVQVPPDDENGESPTSAPARSNTPAAGRPTINGTAQVGQTLTADVSDIDDQDGLENATYAGLCAIQAA